MGSRDTVGTGADVITDEHQGIIRPEVCVDIHGGLTHGHDRLVAIEELIMEVIIGLAETDTVIGGRVPSIGTFEPRWPAIIIIVRIL